MRKKDTGEKKDRPDNLLGLGLKPLKASDVERSYSRPLFIIRRAELKIISLNDFVLAS